MVHVLVCDDDEPIRETFALVLEEQGATIVQAANGVEALATLRESAVPMVALIDYMMPKCDGLELLESVVLHPRLVRKHVFLLMSAGTVPLRRLAAVREIMRVDIMRKPIDIETLQRIVAEAAGRLPSD